MEATPVSNRGMKRRRVSDVAPGAPWNQTTSQQSLTGLLRARNWEQARMIVLENPTQASSDEKPSALALACRLGAPFECIEAILRASPSKIRCLLDARGTPLHEAIVCDEIGPQTIQLLLQADEDLGNDSPRAVVLQDVDGYVPLHLLIRRRFQAHILQHDQGSNLMEILEMLVRSCGKAVVVPDRGEYEEPPIVMALKANVYAPLLQSEDDTAVRIEQIIHEMISCMIRYYPQAASCVFNGHRGQYTALHSAVFHGRCPEILELLLTAEQSVPSTKKAALLANTQGEIPLHFSTMRGEAPGSLAVLANAAPEAVFSRDASGLTPFHWLWVRFISNLLSIEDSGKGNDIVIQSQEHPGASDPNEYTAFSTILSGDFETDISMIRRIDPSVDFLRMRHIPNQVLGEEQATQWADKCQLILLVVRQSFEQWLQSRDNGEETGIDWTREEAVTSLFWSKVVSLLEASFRAAEPMSDVETFNLCHTAFSSSCCIPPVARLVASLFSLEMGMADSNGRLPLHYAAIRKWHAWDWPREDGTSDSVNAQLLHKETAFVLKIALELSPAEAALKKDSCGCLPFHYAVSTFISACTSSGRTACKQDPVDDMLQILRTFIMANPSSLHEAHPRSGLPPFLHASSESSANRVAGTLNDSAPFAEEQPLSIVYFLLREDPSVLSTCFSSVPQ